MEIPHSLKFFSCDFSAGTTFLDPKFAQEHDERISFGHRARVQQPARAGNQQPGRLPAGSPRARTHPTKIRARIQPDLRIQIVHALSQLDSCIAALYTLCDCNSQFELTFTCKELRKALTSTDLRIVKPYIFGTGSRATDVWFDYALISRNQRFCQFFSAELPISAVFPKVQ